MFHLREEQLPPVETQPPEAKPIRAEDPIIRGTAEGDVFMRKALLIVPSLGERMMSYRQ